MFVCTFVRSFVLPSRSWNYFKVLRASNSSGVYLTNHSSESIHIWTIGTLEGRLSFHESSPQGPLLFGILSQYDPKFYLKINIGHCDLYFMALWFWVISWLFDVWTSYLGIKGQYDLTFDLKINVTYISWSSDFVLYLQDCLMHECHIFR